MQIPTSGQEIEESLKNQVNELHQQGERERQVGGRDHMEGGHIDKGDYSPPQSGVDSWTIQAVRSPTEAGDFVNFGNIYKSAAVQFGSSTALSQKGIRTSRPAWLARPTQTPIRRKLDVNSLFQKAQPSSIPTPAPAPTTAVPVSAPQTQQQQQTDPSGPQQSSHGEPGTCASPKHQGSYDSPSVRIPPTVSHLPNQTPSSMKQGNSPVSYHFSPSVHLRQSGNGDPEPNPPSSPKLNRAVTDGSICRPRGTPGSDVPGSPLMDPQSIPPGSGTATPLQIPLTTMPSNMMNVPGSSMPHSQYMGGPLSSVPQGQMPHQRNIPHQMWGYYYPPPHYDPNAQYYYWPPHRPPPPHTPQQAPLTIQPSNLLTHSQTPMTMPVSPCVPRIGVQQVPPLTPLSPHPLLPAGKRSSFIANQPIWIKDSAGEMIDLADVSKKVPPEQEDTSAVPSVKKKDTERMPVPMRLETTRDSVSGLMEPIDVKGGTGLEPTSTADIAIQPKKLNAKNKKGKSSSVGPDNDDEDHVVDHSKRAVVNATTNGSAADSASVGMSLGMAKEQIRRYVKELFLLRHLGRAEGYFSAIPPKFRWYLVEELVHRAVDANELDLDLISEVFAVVATKSLIDENQFSRGFTTQMECLEDTSEYSPNAYNAVARLLRSSKLSQAAVERLTDKMEAVVITPKEKLLKKYALLP